MDKLGNQPQKSMFNIGDYRHNKHTKIESNNKTPVDVSPQRFLQWNERKDSMSPSRDATFTRFVRQDVTGKIGQWANDSFLLTLEWFTLA